MKFVNSINYAQLLREIDLSKVKLCSETRGHIDLLSSCLGDEYIQLVLDPGITSRIEEFVKFASKLIKKEKLNPWVLRDIYKNQLGKKMYFRGLAVDDAEKEKILKKGLFCNLIRNGGTVKQGVEMFLSEGINKIILNHSNMTNLEVTPLMSISEDSQLSVHVAKGEANKINKEVYVFGFSIPVIETIRKDESESFAIFEIPPEYIFSSERGSKTFSVYWPKERPWYEG
ncbi:hypothetical protein HZA97_02205 [Candidatus Woesearchaeota archaeon]|nr:hypothetical protein [Candidatus Woesearchaeota archaeon]